MQKNEIILKRYSNRRLYNLENKKYVNLNEINEMIKNGEKIKVLDNDTGEDITNQILLQIIFNISLDKISMFSTSFLHNVIAMQQSFYNKLFLDFLENSYKMFFNVSNIQKKTE
jgi:polyhydroxyalkanoate synthesis repressor PhaR